jgi:hypothetical protein
MILIHGLLWKTLISTYIADMLVQCDVPNLPVRNLGTASLCQAVNAAMTAKIGAAPKDKNRSRCKPEESRR